MKTTNVMRIFLAAVAVSLLVAATSHAATTIMIDDFDTPRLLLSNEDDGTGTGTTRNIKESTFDNLIGTSGTSGTIPTFSTPDGIDPGWVHDEKDTDHIVIEDQGGGDYAVSKIGSPSGANRTGAVYSVDLQDLSTGWKMQLDYEYGTKVDALLIAFGTLNTTVPSDTTLFKPNKNIPGPSPYPSPTWPVPGTPVTTIGDFSLSSQENIRNNDLPADGITQDFWITFPGGYTGGADADVTREFDFSHLDLNGCNVMAIMLQTGSGWTYTIDNIKLINDADPIPPTFEGDINGDGNVDDLDLQLLLSDYEETGAGGSYSAANLSDLLAQFGETNHAANSVPEPSSFALVLLGALGLAGFARRKK